MLDAKRSSVSHLRTLSTLGPFNDVDRLTIPGVTPGAGGQDVTGMAGRIRLQKTSEAQKENYGSRNWMERQRQYIQAYEYLCHIGEAKEWIEGCLGHTIAMVVDLEEHLRNGVVLAQLAKFFSPELVPRIFDAPKLQFRHSDNINRFFKFVDKIFRFELTDLYEKKNIPKVIYCIHALSFILVNKGLARKIGDLVGKLEFTEEEIRKTQRSLDATGVSMPNFKNVGDAVAGELDFGLTSEESEAEKIARQLSESETDLILFQACSRGNLLRQKLSIELQRLELLEQRIVEFQARCRGMLMRQEYSNNVESFNFINSWTILLQTESRRYLARNSFARRKDYFIVRTNLIVSLQSRARQIIVKQRYDVYKSDVRRRATGRHLIKLQALIRGCRVRSTASERNATLIFSRPAICLLQSYMRGYLFRRGYQSILKNLLGMNSLYLVLQSVSRGLMIRKEYDSTQADIDVNEFETVDLQAQSRGFMARKRCSILTGRLKRLEHRTIMLQSRMRGCLMRRKFDAFSSLLSLEEEALVDVQAQCRGVLSRRRVYYVMVDLTADEACIVKLQSHARGMLSRGAFTSKLAYYKQNMDKIIKVQSFVRARQQGAAYKSLTIGKDPPVSTIKSFVHLLNDSNLDFEEETEMEQVRNQIVQCVRQNEAAEEHIDEMELKIGMLLEQTIKFDDVIQFHNKMRKGVPFAPKDADRFDLKAMTKQARKTLEHYQRLFYLLQTQPIYLARLFSRAREIGMPERELRNIECFVMVLYGYAQKRREEFYLLKLIRQSILQEMVQVDDTQEFLRGNYIWTRILVHYQRGPKERKFLRDLLTPIVTRVVNDDFMDLESDPVLIYKSISLEEELRTSRRSARLQEADREEAILDPETRRMFIKHLRDLRDLTEILLDGLEREVENMPFGIRYIARETYLAMQEHNSEESDESLYRLIGHLLYYRYINPAVISPDTCNVIERKLSGPQRKNLAEVSKMMNQICAGKLFDIDNCLQPLNEFIEASIVRMSEVFRRVTSVPDAELHFDINQLEDLVSTKRPILYIKANDIHSIHSMIYNQINYISTETDSSLRNVLGSLGPPTDHQDTQLMEGMSDNEIQLALDPKVIDMTDPVAEEKALFTQTKRYMLYIIRVQSGANLLEILVQPVSEDDEYKWSDIMQGEKEERQGQSQDGHMVPQDLSSISYSELKREALENILRLEEMGWITRENNYQEILNDIANDIRSQNRRRIERQKELGVARGTLLNLDEKRAYLDSQLQSYSQYLDSMHMTLSKKGKKKTIPFTKQYFHERGLQKAGRMAKFGSRVYSASKLFEKGVLVSIAHEIPPFERIDIVFSCDDPSVFKIETLSSGMVIPGASTSLHLDQLLQYKFDKVDQFDIYDGQVRLRTLLTLNLIFKHWYNPQGNQA